MNDKKMEVRIVQGTSIDEFEEYMNNYISKYYNKVDIVDIKYSHHCDCYSAMLILREK